jgi:hypothetical protein
MEISNIDGRKAIKSTNEFFKKKKKGSYPKQFA